MQRTEATRRIVEQIGNLVGADGAQVVNQILAHAGDTQTLSWSTALSFLILWISASGAFGELQDSLNTIWDIPPRKHPWLSMLKSRLLSLSMVLVLGFFMIVSLMVSMLIGAVADWWMGVGAKALLELVNTLVSLLVFSGLFASVFRLLPDAELRWRDVWPGALVSSALFILGKFALGWYIAHSSFASRYGAAASFVVILFWVFYSAQILYFGAEFTRAYTRRFGSHRDHAHEPPLKIRARA
jgi:membrane protein